MQGEPVFRPAAFAVWGWSLTASTLFHLILIFLSVGDSGTEFPPEGELAAEPIKLRLVSGERSSTESSPEPVRTDRASPEPEPVAEEQPQKRGGAAVSGWLPQARQEETLADDSDYFAKAYLTVNPEPLSPIEIRAPDIGGIGTVQLELSVFIDEYGKVRRVRAETPVMRPYVEAATQAFEATRFKPGEISGRAVKSVIKVVVEFEQL